METELKISIDRKTVLGKGGYSVVYEGKYGDTPIAVKRIVLDQIRSSNEVAPTLQEINNQQKLNHENVLKIHAVEEDDDFRSLSIRDSFLPKTHPFTCFHLGILH